MIVFFVTAIILKIIGKKKNSKKLRIIGNIFLGLGIAFAIPVILLVAYIGFNTSFKKIDMPDGSTKSVRSSKIEKMKELCDDGSELAVEELSNLLDRNEYLVYYYNINHDSVLDKGLRSGNIGIVRTALEHGAVLDDPNKYEQMVYYHNSMELFIRNIGERTISSSDIEVLKLLFEKGAATECDRCNKSYYSNLLGEAVWTVLYNDETVTDAELEFVQVFIDNGITSDSGLQLDALSSDTDVVMDENYFTLLGMVGYACNQ
jgi:hypothetical protein